MQKLLRIWDIASTKDKSGQLPVSPSTVWRWVREGRFPKPFKLSNSVTVWDASMVEEFISKQAAPSSANEVKS
ncbi:AlpA family phage regulatory protein [Massilia sp. WG5]|uniref:helix-turn-helix transcriptional regulator n=1 Tax=Massilia sp. WG5 TaxID=1707785 RepID=UPI0009E88F0C